MRGEVRILSGWSVPVIRRVLAWAIRILLVCGLLLGLTAGINWLSQQPWGGAAGFSCTPSGTLTWRTLPDGDVLLHCR